MKKLTVFQRVEKYLNHMWEDSLLNALHIAWDSGNVSTLERVSKKYPPNFVAIVLTEAQELIVEAPYVILPPKVVSCMVTEACKYDPNGFLIGHIFAFLVARDLSPRSKRELLEKHPNRESTPYTVCLILRAILHSLVVKDIMSIICAYCD